MLSSVKYLEFYSINLSEIKNKKTETYNINSYVKK